MLPSNATEHSHALLKLALELTDACPLDLGVEIALAGSISRGWADEHSDIELNLWVDSLEGFPARGEAWLAECGAENIHQYEEKHPNGSIWLECEYEGAPVEAGWHAIDVCDRVVRNIVAAQIDDASQGYLAESLIHAVPLREGQNLRRWKSLLADYPDSVRRKMIESGLEPWRRYPRCYDLDLAFLLRPEAALIAQRIDVSIAACLRILCAINGQWEPETHKWVARWAESLVLKPDRLAARIQAIYAQPTSLAAYDDLLCLIGETMSLVPAEYDLADDRAKLTSARKTLAARTRKRARWLSTDRGSG